MRHDRLDPIRQYIRAEQHIRRDTTGVPRAIARAPRHTSATHAPGRAGFANMSASPPSGTATAADFTDPPAFDDSGIDLTLTGDPALFAGAGTGEVTGLAAGATTGIVTGAVEAELVALELAAEKPAEVGFEEAAEREAGSEDEAEREAGTEDEAELHDARRHAHSPA